MIGAVPGVGCRSPAPKASTASTKKPSLTRPRQRAWTTGSRRAQGKWPWTARTAGNFALYAFGNIGVGRHPNIRPRLKKQLLDAIAVALEDADVLGLQRTFFVRKRPHRREHGRAQGFRRSSQALRSAGGASVLI